ncbi:13919_t:CDS:2, partial [Funneliformis geosporum]
MSRPKVLERLKDIFQPIAYESNEKIPSVIDPNIYSICLYPSSRLLTVNCKLKELMSVKLGTELKLNAEITFASSTSKKVLETQIRSVVMGHEHGHEPDWTGLPGHGLSDVPCPPKSPGQRPCTTLQIRVVDMKEKSNNENDEQPLNLPYVLHEFTIVIDTSSVKNKEEISISVRKDRIINIKGNSRDTIPGKQLDSKNSLRKGNSTSKLIYKK